jgi:ribosomal protein S18 acetylase RimI-like enzyme
MAISIGELEEAAAGGWRAPEEAALGRWRLRAAEGFTGRANSALATGDPGLPLAAATAEVCRWYQARGLPAMVAVPYPLGQPQGSTVDRFLAERGWTVRSGAATVMTAAPGAVADRAADAAAGVDLDAEPDEGWLALYRYRGRPPPPISRRLLMSAPWQAFASVRDAGDTLAVGRVAAAGDWAGLTAVEVDPRHRRRGLGRAITGALAAVAAGRGLTGLYLQVDNDNSSARSLYRRVGLRTTMATTTASPRPHPDRREPAAPSPERCGWSP